MNGTINITATDDEIRVEVKVKGASKPECAEVMHALAASLNMNAGDCMIFAMLELEREQQEKAKCGGGCAHES